MKVEKEKVVEIHYTLRRADGEVVDSTEGDPPLPYLHGVGDILPGLEKALDGRSLGEKFTVTLEAADAYGDYDEELTDELELNSFPDDVELTEGDEIYLVNEDGEEVPGVIERITDETVVINYNHPLAGETITCDVEIVEIRDATAQELAQGHADDPYADEFDEDDDWDDEEWDDEDEWEEDEDGKN